MSQEIAQPAGIIGRIRSTGSVRAAGPPALRLSSAFLQFAATVLIARTLGEEQSGEFFFWSALILSLGQVATFGLDKVALREVARSTEDSSALNEFVSTIRSIAFVLALGIGSILVGYAFWTHGENVKSPLWYAMLPICLAGVASCRLNGEILIGLSRPMLSVVYRHVLSTALFLIFLLVLRFRLTPGLTLFALTVSFIFAGAAAQIGFGFGKVRSDFSATSWSQFGARLRDGLPLCASAVFASFYYIIPLAILERLHPSDAVAYLTTAYRMFGPFELLSLAVHSIAMPQLSRATHLRDWRKTRQIYHSTVKRGMLLIGIPMLGAIAVAGPLMSIFGEGFIAARPVLRVLLGLGLVSLLLGPAEHLMLMIGKTRKLAVLTFLKLTFSVIAALVLVPSHGPIGMAVALGGGVVLHKAICLLSYQREVRKAHD